MLKQKIYLGVKKCFKIIGSGKLKKQQVNMCYNFEYKLSCCICCFNQDQVFLKVDIKVVKKFFGC